VSLTDIEAVRLKIADRPLLHRESAEGDASSTEFRLDNSPIQTLPAPMVWMNNGLLTENVNYTVDYTQGVITFASAPLLGADLIFQYTSVVFSDTEIQYYLDTKGNVTLASVELLYAWAADAARGAYKESRSGGGGIGSVTVDTSVKARELRATADALKRQYDQLEGTGSAVEYLTEIAWTESMADRLVVNKIIEDLG
jgi:hypothetical protein